MLLTPKKSISPSSRHRNNTRAMYLFIAVIGLVLLSPQNTTSQERKASRKLDLYQFAEVIPMLEQLWHQGKGEQASQASFDLGEAYRLNGLMDSAAVWYLKHIQMGGAKAEAYLQYGQALRTLGEYEKARHYYLAYDSIMGQGNTGHLLAASCDSVLYNWADIPLYYEAIALPEINSGDSDFSPVVHNDLLYFVSDRTNDNTSDKQFKWTSRPYLGIYSVPLGERGGLFFSDTVRISSQATFNDTYHSGPLAFVGDSIAYITKTIRSKAPVDELKIRTHVLKLFEIDLRTDPARIEPFPYNSDLYSVAHPAISSDGSRMVLSSDMPGGYGGMDLYVLLKDQSGWSEPVNLGPAVNTSGNEVFPVFKHDSVLVFSSDLLPGYGGLDLFEVKLSADGQVLGFPVNLHAPFNSPADDFGYWPLADGKSLLSSSRQGGKGFDDIYAIEPIAQYLAGFVKDRYTLEPISNSSVYIHDTLTDNVLVVQTDDKGYYRAPVQNRSHHLLKAVRTGYIEDCLAFDISLSNSNPIVTAPRDLLLDKLIVDKIIVLENILYDFDKWAIRDDARPTLDWLVDFMNRNAVKIELGSHTDSRGSADYNQKLSWRRAVSVVRYLVDKGIAYDRIIPRGYGESQLLNQCSDGVPCSAAAHQLNRRTEFKILELDYVSQSQGNEFIQQFTTDTLLHIDETGKAFFYSCLSVSGSERPFQRRQQVDQAQVSQEPKWHKPLTDSSCYLVQYFESTNYIDINEPLWTRLPERNWYYDGAVYRYFSGCFNDKTNAEDLLKRITSYGYNNAFIIRYSQIVE
jgi:outer membrane protein OmpA-like peptidoglycan-associated protein